MAPVSSHSLAFFPPSTPTAFAITRSPPAPHLLACGYLSSFSSLSPPPSSPSISHPNVKYGLASACLRGRLLVNCKFLANTEICLKWQIRRSNLSRKSRFCEASPFEKVIVLASLENLTGLNATEQVWQSDWTLIWVINKVLSLLCQLSPSFFLL